MYEIGKRYRAKVWFKDINSIGEYRGKYHLYGSMIYFNVVGKNYRLDYNCVINGTSGLELQL